MIATVPAFAAGLRGALLAAATLAAGAASASANAPGPLGVWIDHTGRGAVEITDCAGKLCGKIVWLKDGKNAKSCGTPILGNVKPVAAGKWDKGWIFDPDENAKYDVEITLMGDKLKVLGYAGSKFLSETMMWRRAPLDLPRCQA